MQQEKTMNFGRVYTTRFKLLLALLPISFATSATGIDTKDVLQQKYIETYEALNLKVGECSQLKKQREISITDEWLKSQPALTQKVILFELSKKAEKRCSQLEETNYINAIFELAVIGETDALNEYIELRRYDLPKSDSQKILAELDNKDLNRLAESEKFQLPFNMLSAFQN